MRVVAIVDITHSCVKGARSLPEEGTLMKSMLKNTRPNNKQLVLSVGRESFEGIELVQQI